MNQLQLWCWCLLFALTLKPVTDVTRLHSKAQDLAQDRLKCSWIWNQTAWKIKLGKWWSGTLLKQTLETEWEVRGIVRNNLWDGNGRSSSISFSVSKGTALLCDAMQSYYSVLRFVYLQFQREAIKWIHELKGRRIKHKLLLLFSHHVPYSSNMVQPIAASWAVCCWHSWSL